MPYADASETPKLRRLLTLRRKIFLAFLAMAAISGGLGSYAVGSIGHAGQLTAEIFDGALTSISYARAAATDYALLEAALERQQAESRTASNEALRVDPAHIADLREDLQTDLTIAAERSQSPRAVAAAQRVRQTIAACDLIRGDPSANQPKAVDTCGADVAEQLDVLVNLTAGQGFHDRERALAQIAAGRQLNLLATFLAILLSGLITWLLTRRLIGPVAAASKAAERIANGELDTPIPEGSADELGVLLSAMAIMRDNIRDRMAAEVAQRRSAQTRLVDAIESSNEAVVLVDDQGQIVIANTQSGRFLPSLAERLQPGLQFAEAMQSALDDGLLAFEDTSLAQRLTAPPGTHDFASRGTGEDACVSEAKLPDGRWLRISRSATREGGYVAISSDITALKQRERELQDSKLCLDAALDNMVQGLCLFDAEHRLRFANRRFCEIYGFALEQIAVGTSFTQILTAMAAQGNFTGQNDDLVQHDMRRFIATESGGVHLQNLSRDRVIAMAHTSLAQGGFVVTYEDITERTRAESQIRYMTRHDLLTGLPNRQQFLEVLQQEVAGVVRDECVAVLLMDLDEFKTVNDALGHTLGDRLLQDVATRLSASLRVGDTISRLGGGEFAIILPGLSGPDIVATLAQRFLDTISAPYDGAGQGLVLGASMGVALSTSEGCTATTLLKNAGSALLRAKSEQRGAFCFFEAGMDERMAARRSLALDLRRALAERQFEVFYQPLVDLKAKRLSGFEALLRWRHPERGMISPAEFIPMAEELGLIVDIGAWVLQTACREACNWPAHVRVAVNVSPMQFRAPHLVATVDEVLALSGLPAERLEVEITESTLLADGDATLVTLRALHETGVRIAMDDFGTGYSSLGYLGRFPFDKIKIDQSFVRGLEKPESQAIVRAVIGLGRALGIRITAEGVETAAQLQYLRAEGCDDLQGYLFSRPQPASEIPSILQRLQHGAEGIAEVAVAA
jgi:diguanylate cyclase (GGDEF)-like protein/PAS domain S-box-containing protein